MEMNIEERLAAGKLVEEFVKKHAAVPKMLVSVYRITV